MSSADDDGAGGGGGHKMFCEACGGTGFTLDSGFYYCRQCVEQSKGHRETEIEYQGAVGVNLKRSQKKAERSAEDLKHQQERTRKLRADPHLCERALAHEGDFPAYLDTLGTRLCTATKLVAKMANVLTDEPFRLPKRCVHFSQLILFTYFREANIAFCECETDDDPTKTFCPLVKRTKTELMRMRRERETQAKEQRAQRRRERLEQSTVWEQLTRTFTVDDNESGEDENEGNVPLPEEEPISLFWRLNTALSIRSVNLAGVLYLGIDPMLCIVFMATQMAGARWVQLSDIFRATSNENDVSDECCGENMVYSVTMNDSRIIRGKKFDCSNKWLLERYKLSDKYAINETITVKSPGHPKFVFVTAAVDEYYPSFRALLANIKDTFGCTQHIIAYDLGTVTKNKELINEINSICNLEWRIFDYTQMDEGRVRDLNSRAWKIFVLAHVFSEFDTFVWMDNSIFFESNNLAKLFVPIQSGKIGAVQLPSFSGHGMNRATHPGMYEFLPMHINYGGTKTYELTGNNDPPQFETDFVVVHKSEESRQLMKWALLCAAESNCIVPIGQTRACIYTTKAPDLVCHRVDGSLFGILRYNMEYRREIEDPSFLPQISPNHPRNTPKQLKSDGMNGLFEVNRGQTFGGSKADWLHKVQCC